ncbi:MAG TPA: hypothetical protein VE175_03480, partial [Woeseiaceae bacterium]|nr:hypothetical protein [Woeseiaceae bacterium]
PRRSPLRLHMAEDAPWKEVWRFGIGNIWHASFSGVPESEPADPEPAIRMAEFYPRGGESLTLTTTRPEATRGTTLAFDAVTLATEVGARSRNAAMTLDYRATRGAQHVIRLPRDADAVGVSIDGADAPLRADDGELSLPILPGRHSIELRWRRDAEVGAIVRTPAVDLGADAGNIGLHLDLPPSRWVLATSGPRLGPAVMYWSELAAMILFAVVLGRTTLTPLKTRQWLLLGLGFSTFSWPVLLLVTFWLLAVGARGRGRAPGKALHFNALQVAFGALTIVALIAIVVSVPAGLLGAPDMHVAGNGSYGNGLRWFADRSSGAIPQASAFSLPLWAYKGLILAWALWLSFALLKWLPWVWRTFASQGLWRRPSPVVEGTPAS